ncbi:Fibrinogen C domain-containing protein 1 [Holothuria leucospilota]|uniref:Fibrinogen C domain-containing protein 1 n=1 Tax=Holothuria leucospilota TaxID=206669 RepID=A0A9Q0YRD1_HOLLE|nr:Fibrinogen C domain-containing protein 1 [Holothuria leucospilota]
MLLLGVFRVFFWALFGVVTVMLLSQCTSAAVVLKNSCPPSDYLCNYIYQLKLETHGLISQLERRYPDLVNGKQNRDERGGDHGLGETEKENIQELEEVSVEPIQFSKDVSLSNSLNENTTTETTADVHGGTSPTSQTPSTSVRRNDTIPTHQQSTPVPVPDNVEQEGGTSPTQSNHAINSTTALSAVDLIASGSQGVTTDGGSTFEALSDQSTTKPVPGSTLDSDDSVTQVTLDDKTPTKPTTSVTDEQVNSRTSSVESMKEGEKTSHFTIASTSKPVPVTLGQVDINGGSQFISKVTEVGTTELPSVLTTDARHKSSTRASSMITKSTTEEGSGPSTNNPLRVMRVSSEESTPSIDSTEMDHQTTLSPVSLTTVSAYRSSTSAFRANTATGSTVEVTVTSKAVTQTEDTFGSGDTHLVSPSDVVEFSTASVSSTLSQARTTNPGETNTSGSLSESTKRTPEFEGNMTVIEGKWTAPYNTDTLSTEIPETEIFTEEIELTTFSEITSGVNIRDATTRRALEVSRRLETTQSPPTSQSRQTEGDAIQPEDSYPTSTTKSTFETDVTILEDEIFVTSLDDMTDTYVTSDKHFAASKFPTTETVDETDVVEEIFVTAEMDVTTNVYDETDKYTSIEQDITSKTDGTTEKYVVTDKDVPSTKHHTTEQEVTTRKNDTTEEYETTEKDTKTIGATTDTVQTSLMPTTTIPTTTQEPTTPTPAPPRDCDEIWRRGSRESGIYTIFPDMPNSRQYGFQVFCHLQDNDGGWTVIQRRVNGSVNFYRPWFDYFLGFGTLQREFYLGNEKIHLLTNQKKYELSILLWDFEGESRYARYQLFRLGDYMSSYELSVRGYTGNAGNSLGYHSRGRFSTFDRDVDDNPAFNCARMYGSGWWFKDCNAKSNLNGIYLRGEHTRRGRGITWKKWKGLEYSLRYSEMRIKPNGL